jgi:cytochrome o ubiquinol oxidase subunit 1
LLQIFYSLWQRKKHLDTTGGDPWNGRTLEWSTTSPPPFYNFAIIPKADVRDAWWEAKESGLKPPKPIYHDIELPKNSPYGVLIAASAFVMGFAIVWHIWWLAVIGLLGIIVCMIIRLTDEHTEYTVTAAEIAKLEAKSRKATT